MDSTENIQLAHGRVRICDEGPRDGPVILWVHGASYPLEVFSALTGPLIALGFRCIRFDLYGRGFSDWDGHPLSTETLADQAFEVLKHLKVGGQINLVSLSNADLIVNMIASRRPKQVASIIWIAPSGIDRRTINPLARLIMRMPGFTVFGAAFMKHYLIRRMKAHRSHLDPSSAPLSNKIYELSIQSLRENRQAAAAACSQLKHQPTPGEIEVCAVAVAGARIPVLLLSFGEENDSHQDDLKLFRQHIAPTEFHVERGSHMALLEIPKQIVPHLQQFLGA